MYFATLRKHFTTFPKHAYYVRCTETTESGIDFNLLYKYNFTMGITWNFL